MNLSIKLKFSYVLLVHLHILIVCCHCLSVCLSVVGDIGTLPAV